MKIDGGESVCVACGKTVRTIYTQKYITQKGHAKDCSLVRDMEGKSLLGVAKWRFR